MLKHTIEVPDCGSLTRVGYVDVPIPPEAAGLTPSDFADIPWRSPLWSEGDQLRAGVAAWFAELGGQRWVFDPVQAADDVLRANRETERAQQTTLAELFASAGFPRESVDQVVLSHIEGIGMVGWRDDEGLWSPFFPNARIWVSDTALQLLTEGPTGVESPLEREAWSALMAKGVIDTYKDGQTLGPGLVAHVAGGHHPGHALLNFGKNPQQPAITMVGHLAVSPLHLATGECQPQHTDPTQAWEVLREVAQDGRTLIGPLWPSPGFGRWVDGTFEPGT